MKRFFKILVVLIVGCAPTYKTPPSELYKFTLKGDTVLYNKKPIAYLYSMEYEFYRGHYTLEYSLKQIGATTLNDTTRMIVDFVRLRHPNAKVEVKMESKY